MQIIYTILGVPFEDLQWLTNETEVRSSGSSNAREASAANQYVLLFVRPFVARADFDRKILDYMASLVEERMQEPKDDLISRLVVEQVQPGHLEQAEATQIAFLLLVAGNATMVSMIALVSFFNRQKKKSKLKLLI